MTFTMDFKATLSFDSDILPEALHELAAEKGIVTVKVQENDETEVPEIVLLYEDDDCFQCSFSHTSAANEAAKAFAEWLRKSFVGLDVKIELLDTDDNTFKLIRYDADQ